MYTINIIGAGTAGCFTVLHLAKKYPNKKIYWSFKDLNNNIGVGEATVPYVLEFLKEIGYDYNYLVKNCNASLKLGIKFENFSDKNFYHPFGNTEEEQNELMYMCEKNKIPHNILDYDDIACHFDVKTLISDMYKQIKKLKNVHIINKNKECDLKIDCTGFNSLKKINYKQCEDIQNNQALIYRTNYNDKVKKIPYTLCTGLDNGWVWKISLKNEVSYGYVNNGNKNNKDEFKNYLKNNNINFEEDKIKLINFLNGRRETHLTDKECYIGLSSSFIEPLESTGLYFTCFGICLLSSYINGDITIDKFNKTFNKEFDSIYNFIIAHYTKSNNENLYWKKMKNKKYKTTYTDFFPETSWKYIINGLDNGNNIKFTKKIKSLVKGKKFS